MFVKLFVSPDKNTPEAKQRCVVDSFHRSNLVPKQLATKFEARSPGVWIFRDAQRSIHAVAQVLTHASFSTHISLPLRRAGRLLLREASSFYTAVNMWVSDASISFRSLGYAEVVHVCRGAGVKTLLLPGQTLVFTACLGWIVRLCNLVMKRWMLG